MEMSRENLKELIETFYNKWHETDTLWRNEFSPYSSMEYKGFNLKISYGIGVRVVPPKFPYITFLKYRFRTSKGVYPYIAINTHKNLLETSLGVSYDDEPDVSYEKLEKIKEYSMQHIRYFSVNEVDELIQALNKNIQVFEEIINSNEDNKTMLKTKNIILYGVPGVGKTHNINKLIKLIEEDSDEQKIFQAIKEKEKYDREDLDAIKDRIEFVTFHQSFGYEDFIEGFRPNKKGNIELQDGVFKKICDKAKGILKLSDKYYLNREIVSDRSVYHIVNITSDLINITKQNNNRIIPIPKALIIELMDYIEASQLSLEDIKYRNLDNVDLSFDKYLYGFNSVLYAICKNIQNFDGEENRSQEENYYLIIDEINRGNISKIFGELITLIEEDKRNTYEVTLPYSKEKFSVPSNLYIIGTMNSTDKSIALIDIALRRRFTFLKMQPNDGLVPEFSRDLFKSLNDKIKEKLGDEYQIGHSYFMNIADKDTLNFVLKYKIKPLLEEYFYGDKAGLEEVLNVMKERGE